MPSKMYPSRESKSYPPAESMIRAIGGRRLRILIVDDNDAFRKSMKFILKRYGADVSEVDSGVEAVEVLAGGDTFDLIFLDLVMPEMGGMETYAQLKKIDAGCSVVIMSAYFDSKDWEEAGNQDVIVLAKPIPSETITQLLFDAANHEAQKSRTGSECR